MKRAKVIAHRTKPNGTRVIWIACPICDRRHWIAETTSATCPRKPGRFAVT